MTIYEIGQDRVRVSGAGADPDSTPVHFISMELVAGETLGQKIHEEKADLRTLLGYLAQAAEGIAKAHAAGIVFTQNSEKDLIPHIWRVDPDGGGLRQLTEGKGEQLIHLSRDGGIALFQKDDDPTSVWSLDPVAGGEAKRLASNTTGDGGFISPDGRLVRYTDFTEVQGRIYGRHIVIPSAGGEPVAKFLLPPGAASSSWSPDNSSVSYVDRNKGWNLMRQPIGGGPPTELTRLTEGVTTDFAWSPDGAWIGVARRIGQKCGLWLVQLGKGDPKLLTEFRTGRIGDLRWSLDSKSIFFVYGTSSKDVVLISDFQ